MDIKVDLDKHKKLNLNIKEILTNRFTAKWWSDKKVDDKKLQYVLDCAYLAPSKRSEYDYEILVLGDSPKAKEIKDWLYWENSWCYKGERAPEGVDGTPDRRYNGQCQAPVVLVWQGILDRVSYNRFTPRIDEPDLCRDMAISASIAMMAAEEVGLHTGLQSCFEEDELGKKLGKKWFSYILLGIGDIDKYDHKTIFPDSGHFPGRFVYKDGKHMGFDFGNNPAYDKEVNISRKGKKTKEDIIKFV